MPRTLEQLDTEVAALHRLLHTHLGGVGVSTPQRPHPNMRIDVTYTITNGSTDRTYDANATTVDELADILSTLITDLKQIGLVG